MKSRDKVVSNITLKCCLVEIREIMKTKLFCHSRSFWPFDRPVWSISFLCYIFWGKKNKNNTVLKNQQKCLNCDIIFTPKFVKLNFVPKSFWKYLSKKPVKLNVIKFWRFHEIFSCFEFSKKSATFFMNFHTLWKSKQTHVLKILFIPG